MGRAPCCDKNKVRKGAWSPEEDHILVQYIMKYGHGTWRALPRHAGLQRCGKSCRLRWINYLRPDIRRGPFTPEEEATIIRFHQMLGNRWSTIASQLPGRTDNEIKNFWNTHLKKRVSYVSNDKQHQKDPKSPKDAVQSETSSTSHPEINNENNNGVEADGSIKPTSPSPSNSCSMDDNNDLQLPSNSCSMDDNNDLQLPSNSCSMDDNNDHQLPSNSCSMDDDNDLQLPSNSCFMEDNNDFLKWLFDIDEDESIGNLSGRDMDRLDLVLQDMDMIDGPIASQNGPQDDKKDIEETFTEPTAPSSSSNINEDSLGSQLGAISQTQTTPYVEENHDLNSKSDSLVHQANDNQAIEQGDSKAVAENMFPESTSSFPCDLEDYLGPDLGFLLDFPLEDLDI